MSNVQKPTIAVFDFDGTITTKDTLFDFIAFYKGKTRMYAGLAILLPMLVLFKLGAISNEKAKQRLFSYFFAGEPISRWKEKCEAYKNQIPNIVRPEALARIKWHQEQEHNTIIISASVVDWITPWANSIGIKTLLGTGIEVENDVITGKFSTYNCHGQEKVNRLLKNYPDRDSYELYMYGDSSGDKQMLALADYPFYRKFE